jgi:3-hydroxyisobutyrate dehydrogenase-like beta-hydroxyacid dehydrogenase
MFRIGFIGLGIMGSPMAANLARAGHQVTGPDSPHVSEVAFGPFGIIKTLEAAGTPGVIYIDFSTMVIEGLSVPHEI